MNKLLVSSTVLALLLLGAATNAFARPRDKTPSDLDAYFRDKTPSDLDAYFIERFDYIFGSDPSGSLDRSDQFPPLKDATALVARYYQVREQLLPSTVASIDALLEVNPSEFIYDTEHFRFHYELEGRNAVPADDLDGSGVPDYVENAGEYAEYSWWREVDDLGFYAPRLTPTEGGRMAIIFQDFNVYGMTTCPGLCSIRVENDFKGFSPNDDPEGSVAGAAKVTLAHEFKHTIQWETSNMTELGWIELDATWMEDIVYPYVNDYVYYINSSESQIVTPSDPLDKWLYGSYYDAIFEISMSERFGAQLLVDFWDYRANHRAEGMLTSYDAILKTVGSSLEEHFCHDYMLRNYLTGGRIPEVDLPTYPDAALFQEGPIIPITLPGTLQEKLPHLAGQFFEVQSDGSSLMPRVSLEADRASVMAIIVVLWHRNGTVTTVPVEVKSGNGSVILDEAWSRLTKLGLVVCNAERASTATYYSLTVQ